MAVIAFVILNCDENHSAKNVSRFHWNAMTKFFLSLYRNTGYFELTGKQFFKKFRKVLFFNRAEPLQTSNYNN